MEDAKMGPENKEQSLSDVVTKVIDDEKKEKKEPLMNSKGEPNREEKQDEEKSEKDEEDGKKDDLCMGVDVGELRLMIQKSPSVIQCEQEELSKREAILLIGIFIAMTIACTVLIIIIGAFREKNKCLDELANNTKIMKKLTEEPQYCPSSVCMQISSTLLQSRSNSKPCQDFYSYTCAHWSKLHPHVESDWSAEDELRMRIKVTVVKKLQSTRKESSVSIQRAKELFASCMDTEKLDNSGPGALNEAIDSVGGWNLKSGWVQKPIEEQLATLHIRYWDQILFSVRVVPDPGEMGRYIIELGRGDLTLYKPSDYSDPDKEKAFTNYAINTAMLLGVTRGEAEQFAYNVFKFEEGVAKIQEQSFTPVASAERIKISDLQLDSPEINWLKYLKTSRFDVTEESYILVTNKNYMKAISAILKAANRTTFNNYVVWHLIDALANDLNRGFRLAAVEFEMAMKGRASPRWEHCYGDVEEYYKMAVGNLYSQDVVNTTELTQLVENINLQLQEKIADRNFTMPEQTREDVLQMLQDVRVETVASLLERGVDMMDTVYSFMHFTAQDTYQQKLAKLIKANSDRLTEIYSDPQIVTNEWPIASTDISPYYCRHKNKLYIPAGSLDAPVYHPKLPLYYNYATMGRKIALELLKALDPEGVDDNVNGVPSWLDVSSDTYTSSYGCISQTLTTEQQTKLSSAAILADVTALGVAFEAFVSVGGREQTPLAAVGLSIDQTFYTSSVLAQCSNDMSKGNRWRIILSQQPGFTEAFHCSEQDVCSLWS